MSAQPPIVTRGQWGARFARPTGRHIPLSARRFLVVHWPGSAGTVRDARATWRAIEADHRNRHGWAVAPGYHWGVTQTGEILEGGPGRDQRGIHSPARNSEWSVCVLHGQGETLSAAARNSTRRLYDWLCGQAGRRLTQSWHAADFPTACPGPQLISWVRSGMPGGALPPPTTVPPVQTPPPQENDLVGMGLNAGGILHQFRIFQGAVWYRFRNRQGWTDWARFAPLPDPSATLLSVAPGPDTAGAFNVCLDSNRDGRSWRTWQRRGQAGWEGGQAGRQVAGFQAAGRIAA